MIHIILFQPEIPENTGNIARSCVGFNAILHLIRPYGFILSSPKLKRAGVNYWKHLQLFEYDSFDEFLVQNNFPNIYIYTRYGNNKPDEIDYQKLSNIYLMFGKESSGVDLTILKKYPNNLIRIPTSQNIRSLNLANTVSIALYEVTKQNKYQGLELKEPHKKVS